MQELKEQFGRFVAGGLTRDEFRSVCDRFVSAHPELRATAAVWFGEGVQAGRVTPAVWDSIADLFAGPAVVHGSEKTIISVRDGGAAPRAAAPAEAGQDTKALAIGGVLNGRYRLVDELGRGGMGQVFKAIDRNLERANDPDPFVALKALNAKYARDVDARDALQFEAMRAKNLSHENVIRVHDFDWDGPHVFITMEYLKGSPLDRLIETEYARGLDIGRAWPIIEGIGNALDYGHRKGVIHSDVKPSNVFITRKNQVKVLDFGISRPMAKSAATEFDTIYEPVIPLAGLTPSYASLEQWTGEPPDPRDDIYSFALVAYELLSGHHPFASVSAKKAFESGLSPQRPDNLSRVQWDALRSALALTRERRTKTVKEFLRALAPQTFLRKHRMALLGGGAVAAAIAVGLGGHYFSDYIQHQTLGGRARTKHPPVVLNDSQKKEITESLGLAQDFLKDAKPADSPEDMAYVLSEGANNVNQIADSILAMDPDNEKALELKARIAEMYLAKAQSLYDQRQYAAAMALVGYGRKVAGDNVALFKLQERICDDEPGACPAPATTAPNN